MMPYLLGTHEIRLRLGNISRQRVHQIVNYRHFPKPIAHLALGNVWLADDVDAWIREHRPRDASRPH
jgi:predicted DNA-binding transcriptional regulator AlpA